MSARNLNTGHPFQPIWALCPGWSPNLSASGASNAEGEVTSVGKKQTFVAANLGTPTGTQLVVEPRTYGRGIGSVRSLILTPSQEDRFGRLEYTADDLGVVFPNLNNLCIVGICHLTGDGRPGGVGDPRIFMKGLDATAAGHDFMIGISNAGNSARTRIRMNGSTVTVQGAGGQIQDDALNLFAGGISGTTVTLRHIKENGVEQETTGSGSGSYDPRTTTDIAIGANAIVADNALEGEIIVIAAFAHNLEFPALRSFFYNPWQIFQLETQLIPTELAPPPTSTFGVVRRWV